MEVGHLDFDFAVLIPAFLGFPGSGKMLFWAVAAVLARRFRTVDRVLESLPLLVAEQWHQLARGPILSAVLIDAANGVERASARWIDW